MMAAGTHTRAGGFFTGSLVGRLGDVPSKELEAEVNKRARAIPFFDELAEVLPYGKAEFEFYRGRLKFVRLHTSDMIDQCQSTS